MRLIDADALLETLNKEKIPYNADINFFIMDAPTVDLKPVRHGRWLFDGKSKCSECGQTALYYMGITWCSDYCPHCGAKMR